MQQFDIFFPHETRIRIPMSMVDPGNVVYHSRYLDLYHEARDRYMDAAGHSYALLMENNYHLAVADAHLQFRKPVRYMETAIIRTRFNWIKTRSLSVIQEISKETDGMEELCNRAEIILVCIGPKFTATHIPESLKESIASFQTNPVK